MKNILLFVQFPFSFCLQHISNIKLLYVHRIYSIPVNTFFLEVHSENNDINISDKNKFSSTIMLTWLNKQNHSEAFSRIQKFHGLYSMFWIYTIYTFKWNQFQFHVVSHVCCFTAFVVSQLDGAQNRVNLKRLIIHNRLLILNKFIY